MKKSLKWFLLLTLILSMVTVFMLSGCKEEATVEEATVEEEEAVAEEAEEEKFTIGYVPTALTSPYWITMADAFEESIAKNKDMELLTLAPTVDTAFEEQVKILEDLIQKKVDLIAVSSGNWDSVVPVLNKAIENGIEVVFIDRVLPLEGVDAVSMLGVDEIKGGEIAGNYAVEVLNEKGKVVILEGVTGDYWSERRTEGFLNIADLYPDIEVVAIQPTNWGRAESMSAMENILQANEDIDLVWGLCDNIALGAEQAIKDAGLQDKIMIVGYNGDEEACEAIKAGRMKATIGQQPGLIGQTIIEDIVVKLMSGEKEKIESVINIPVVLVTVETVEDFMNK